MESIEKGNSLEQRLIETTNNNNSSPIMKFIVQKISRFSFFIIIFWLLVIGGLSWTAPKLIAATRNGFDPPINSQAGQANTRLNIDFPEFSVGSDYVIYAYRDDHSSILSPQLGNFSLALNHSMYSFSNIPNFIQTFQNYYLLLSLGLPKEFASKFLSKQYQNSMIMPLSINIKYSQNIAYQFSDYVRAQISNLRKTYHVPSEVNFIVSGFPAFITLIVDNAERDLAIMDAIVLPIAIIILSFLLRTIRLSIITIICIGTSTISSFAAVYALALTLPIVSISISLMFSLLIATSIDYSLFLLSRFREELLNYVKSHSLYPEDMIDHHHLMDYVVEKMLYTAGHTCLMSGLTLMLCFLGLFLLPAEFIQSVGMSCSITITLSIFINLTLTPALLFQFPNFFSRCILPFSFYKDIFVFNYGTDPYFFNLFNYENKPIDNPDLTIQSNTSTKRSCWYGWGRLLVSFPWNLIAFLLVFCCTLPFFLNAFDFPTTSTIFLTLPSGAPETIACQRMFTEFGNGQITPYKLLFETQNDTVLSESFITNAQNIVTELANNVPDVSIDNFNGFFFGEGFPIPYDMIVKCLNSSEEVYFTELCHALRFSISMFVNQDQNSTWMSVILSQTDPLGENGMSIYKTFIKNLNSYQLQLNGTINIYLQGMASDMLDVIQIVYQDFTYMITLTMIVVIVLAGLIFRSIIIPLRCIISLGVTLLYAYGLANMVYVNGLLNGFHIHGISQTHALFWLIPLISLSLIVGIGLDYDIFFINRIHEYRKMGYNNNDSIILGLTQTGHLITTAGIIMSVAFAGLLFSNQLALNQLAFYLVFSALFDTFVVRSVLVPSMMSFFGRWNWWPSELYNINETKKLPEAPLWPLYAELPVELI